jgi:anthranilate phosphoribosyltransferase
VLLHGAASESTRVFTADVLQQLDIPARSALGVLRQGEIAFVPTALLCPGVQRLLDVRRAVGVRNPAHSLVKIMTPCAGKSLVLASYTHPEYALSMAATFELTGANAILMRGTEGEPVADPRRMPQMVGFVHGQRTLLQEAQSGSLSVLPELPKEIDAASTARYTRAVLEGSLPVPGPIAQQLGHILDMVSRL